MNRLVAGVAAVLLAGCLSPTPAPLTPDTGLGLVKGSVFDVPTPPAVKPNESAPGERPVLSRPYTIAPPSVPHAVADFLPITPKQNACVDCHAVTDRKPGQPTPLPPSHYTDYRNGPGRVGERVAGARHVCLSCHVPQTEAPDLLEGGGRR